MQAPGRRRRTVDDARREILDAAEPMLIEADQARCASKSCRAKWL